MFRILLFLPIIQPYITFDSGTEIRFSYQYSTSFSCKNSKTYSYTTLFSGEFQNKPKVIFSNYHYDIYQGKNEFTFKTVEITTKNFTSTLQCLTVNDFYGLKLDWIAIDDLRVEVLNFFNTNVTDLQSQQFTTSHDNINSLSGFVTFISFGFKGDMNFNLTLQQITETQVIYSFATANQNLLSLGFQIVLGTKEAFTYNQIYKMLTNSTIKFDTGFLAVPSDQTLIIPLIGVNYLSNLNLRLNRTTILKNSAGVQYQYFGYYGSYADLYVQNIIFVNNNLNIINPYVCKKMRVSMVQNTTLPNQALTIKILELGQTLDTTTQQSYFCDKTKLTLRVIAYFKCAASKKVIGQIFNCIGCNNQFININQNCYGPANLMTIFMTFYQPAQINQKINVNLTSPYFTMTQTVKNRVEQSYVLVNLALVNV